MDIGGEAHLGDEGNARAGNAGGVRLFEGQSKMGGLDRFYNFLAQFREKLGNNAISCEPLPIFGLEELFSNDSVGINKIISRAGKALLHACSFSIEDAIGFDGLGIRVRKHRVSDIVPVSKILQDFFRVIADGRELDPLLFESRNGALQLDQLPCAEGSPVGGTQKKKNGAFRSFHVIGSLYAPRPVMKLKRAGLLTNPTANRQ